MTDARPGARADIHVVAAVIEQDNRFLVTRRQAGVHLAGLWEFPGGKIHERETHTEALRREGYVGPFGIDAWAYGNSFNPLGEINARMTFGLVAWALAERLGIERLRLRFGSEAPEGAIPLLAGTPSAWIETF